MTFPRCLASPLLIVDDPIIDEPFLSCRKEMGCECQIHDKCSWMPICINVPDCTLSAFPALATSFDCIWFVESQHYRSPDAGFRLRRRTASCQSRLFSSWQHVESSAIPQRCRTDIYATVAEWWERWSGIVSWLFLPLRSFHILLISCWFFPI